MKRNRKQERTANMGFINKVGKTLSEGFSRLEEKNRRSAYLNRIRAALKREEKAAQREYIALGRYYYNNLRDQNDQVAEKHCTELEIISKRIEAAIDRLEECYAEMAEKKAAQYEEIDLDDVQCLEDPVKREETPPLEEVKDELKESVNGTQESVKKAAKAVYEEVVKTVYEEAADSRDQVISAVQAEAEEIQQAAARALEDMRRGFDSGAKAADESENDNLPFE